MHFVRWFLFALGFALGSIAGGAVRGDSPDDDLKRLPPVQESDDPLELSGWVGGHRLVWADQFSTGQDPASGPSNRGWALGPSAPGFDCFISPMTNPVFFEDPRTLTEARVIMLNQKLPTRGPLSGGDFQFLGVQARAALSDRLSVVMAKSGFLLAGEPTPFDDGWADVALGLKYNLLADPDTQRIVSVGAHYEMPVGSPRAFQGNGSGEYNMYLTGATAVFDNSHLLSALGVRLPGNAVAESQVLYWSTHWDTRIGSHGLYFLAEANWYHYLNSGKTVPVNFEGLDLFNFGSTNVAGNDIVTGAVGFKLKPSPSWEFGVAYEIPLTDRRDVLNNRLTIDVILRF